MFSSLTVAVIVFCSAFSMIKAAPSNLVARSTYTGDATTYSPSQGLGACGWKDSDTDYVVAVDAAIFDSWPGAGSNPNKNPICGKTLTATYTPTGASVKVKVVDRCPSCAYGALDFAPAPFTALTRDWTGRYKIGWHFD